MPIVHTRQHCKIHKHVAILCQVSRILSSLIYDIYLFIKFGAVCALAIIAYMPATNLDSVHTS